MKKVYQILFVISAMLIGTGTAASPTPILNSKANSFSIFNFQFSINFADGRKLRYEASTTLQPFEEYRTYSGNLVFGINDDLEYIIMPEGRIINNGGTFTCEYHLRDHTGSTNVAFIPDQGVVQENTYYPFGSPINNLTWNALTNTKRNPYLREGKEYIAMYGWNKYDFLNRTFDTWTLMALQPDPMADMYYGISPYALWANNPMKYVDPDGKVIKIWYNGHAGKMQSFVYSGQHVMHSNAFVNAVISAYQYNKSNGARAGNGGGAPTVTAVERSDISINVMETPYGSVYNENAGGTIYWNPELGNENNGIVWSPATVFDHEADHAVDAKMNPEGHERNTNTPDSRYYSKEERRVITGSEQKTARANGETKQGQNTRTNHGGKSVITRGVTSNEIDPQKTKDYEERDKQRGTWTPEL